MASPSQSEMSSEDKYVAMSPPHLLHQTYQQYHDQYPGQTSYTTTSSDQQTLTNTSSFQQSSDITPESQHIF